MDPTPPLGGPGPAVLLVEDDEVLADLLVRHLVRRGHRATACGTAAAAITALDRGLRPGLIILDINLPDGAGWQVARDPAYVGAGSPPIVVASAVGVRPEQLAAAGIAGYLPKPFPLRTFMDVVERHLRPADAPAAIEEPS